LALPLETEETAASSALTTVRLRRRLGIEEAARRSGLGAEELTWLEEGRLYRFAGDEALTAAVLYGAALEIDLAEARELAGLPPPKPKSAEGDINWTRQTASRVGALGYRLGRLAHALGTVTSPLPGGLNPRRLVLIVGPHRGPG
jgi:hypothetical protein